MRNRKFNSRALRHLGEELVRLIFPRGEIPDDEQEELVTSLVRLVAMLLRELTEQGRSVKERAGQVLCRMAPWARPVRNAREDEPLIPGVL